MFEREVLYNARVADFDRVTVQEAVIVRFASSSRDEIIKICLNRMSGDFIWAEHMPPARREECDVIAHEGISYSSVPGMREARDPIDRALAVA